MAVRSQGSCGSLILIMYICVYVCMSYADSLPIIRIFTWDVIPKAKLIQCIYLYYLYAIVFVA